MLDPAPKQAEPGAARETRLERQRRWLLPVGLLVLFVVVQARYLRPPTTEDPMNYFEDAARFPHLSPDHWALRIGLVLPVRGLQALFGYSEAAYYALPLVTGAVLVLATYAVGAQLFGRWVGFGAAVVLMLSPPFLQYSSSLLPDHIAAGLFTAGLALVIFVARRDQEWTRRSHVVLAVAGFLFGWAYLVRETMPLLFPVVVYVFWSYRVPWPKLRWVAGPAVALLVAEMALNWRLYGSPIKRFVVSGGHGGQRDYITDSRLDALERLPSALWHVPGGRALAVLVCVVPIALLFGGRSQRAIAVWSLAYWVPLTLGTGLLMPSFRFIQADNIRYWSPIVPAVAIGSLAVAQAVAQRVPRFGAGLGVAAVTALVIVVSAGEVRGIERAAFSRGHGATQLAEVRSWLADHGASVPIVWTDSRTARVLPIFTRSTFGDPVWHGEIRAFNDHLTFIDPSQIDRGAVVLYPAGYHGVPVRGRDLPRGIRLPRPGWRIAILRSDGSLRVYVTDR